MATTNRQENPGKPRVSESPAPLHGKTAAQRRVPMTPEESRKYWETLVNSCGNPKGTKEDPARHTRRDWAAGLSL